MISSTASAALINRSILKAIARSGRASQAAQCRKGLHTTLVFNSIFPAQNCTSSLQMSHNAGQLPGLYPGSFAVDAFLD
jgi:hypothetical protein